MSKKEKLLVVIDPTEDDQSIIDRAVLIAKNFEDKDIFQKITLYVTSEIGKTSKQDDKEYRNLSWVADLEKPFIENGIAVTTRLSWAEEWAKSIIDITDKEDFDFVFLPYRAGNDKQKFSDDFWYLIRNSKVPVGLMGAREISNRRTVLVSINLLDPKMMDLNRKKMEEARIIAESNKATLHTVTSYYDSSDYPDRGKLVERTGLPNDQVHIKLGPPEEVIVEVAEEIDCDLLMLGVAKRSNSSLKSALMGRKIDKIIKNFDRDMLLIV